MPEQPERVEYDEYVEGYWPAKDRQLALSGESADFFSRYKVAKIAEWLPELDGRDIAVLDYGCGIGVMTDFFHQRFPAARTQGVDPSAKSIEQAAVRYPGILFRCVQGHALPFADHSFDFAYASGVFHHISVGEHRAYLDEIFRVLKPGAPFVLFELNPFNPLTLLVFFRSPFDRNARLMFPRYARELLRPYGRVALKYYAFFPAFLAKLRPLEPALERVPLGALYAAIVRKSEARNPKFEINPNDLNAKSKTRFEF